MLIVGTNGLLRHLGRAPTASEGMRSALRQVFSAGSRGRCVSAYAGAGRHGAGVRQSLLRAVSSARRTATQQRMYNGELVLARDAGAPTVCVERHMPPLLGEAPLRLSGPLGPYSV